MKTLTLKNKFQTNATLLPNDFIDNYMIDANGDFVKVYLFLLRHLDDPCSSLTLTTIADCLSNTENDILRAFRYWEKKGLLRMERDSEGRITALELFKTALIRSTESVSTASPSKEPAQDVSGASVPVRRQERMPAESASDTATAGQAVSASALGGKAVSIDTLRAQKEIKSLLFIAEQYLGKTLTHSDM